MKIALAESFRYVHEPLRSDERALDLLGNTDLVDALRSRIAHSRGGAFLITGFRGVGKSTVVVRTLEEIGREPSAGRITVPVVLSVARSTSTDRLLFAVIRRTFETLHSLGHLNRLPAETRHSLLLAYIRTSLSFKETQNSSTEQSAGLELGLGTPTPRPMINLAVPKLNMSVKRSRSLATEASFLAYSETDVEYDLTRIITLLGEDREPAPSSRSALRRLVRRHRPDGPPLHLIIVLDEVDKLTAGEAGLAAVEDLLAGIKNVLSSTGAHFLLVAGTDMHDRAVKDASRGNSVYESVFAWRMYVPCIWQAPTELIARMVDIEAEGAEKADLLRRFTDYLAFKARGVPRRLLQEFNSFVSWEDGRPCLRIDDADRERIGFYARLQAILAEHFAGGHRQAAFPLAVDNDRQRLGIYYVMDGILRTEGEAFSAADLLAEGREMDLDPSLRVSERGVERLLQHLAAHRIVTVVQEMNSSVVMIQDVAAARKPLYRLADEVQSLMYGIAVHSEVEREALDVSISLVRFTGPGSRRGDASAPRLRGRREMAGRYELGELLGQGGMGQVYRAHDRLFGSDVAIKVLPPSLLENAQAMARFRRETDIASRARHPQIVRTLDVITDPELGLGLVMELLAGDTLRARVETRGALSGPATAHLGRKVADALDYLEHQRLARFDLKPSNIILEPVRGPVIIDLGIARHVERPTITITRDRTFIGTPHYMAPEQLSGDGPLDIRADVYSLGQVLYFCLEGRTPWHDLPLPGLLARLVNDDVDVSELPVSPEFRTVLGRALARDPDQRYAHPAELHAALERLPELYQGREDDAAPFATADGLRVGTAEAGDTRWDHRAGERACPNCHHIVRDRFCEICGYDSGRP